MEKIELFINLLRDVLECANEELCAILDGKSSKWNAKQVLGIVIPEASELLKHALDGEIYFKYGEKQRLLSSSYSMTDTLVNLEDTCLGKKITELQNVYTSL